MSRLKVVETRSRPTKPANYRGEITWPDVTNTDTGQPRKKSLANVLAFLTHVGATLQRNEFTRCDELTRGGQTRPLSDSDVIALHLEAHALGLDVPKEFFGDCLTDQARQHGYHPVRDALAGLVWDRTPRLDNWLHRYAGATDSALTRTIGRLFLIAAVRRIRQPGAKFDQCLVLEGPQGAGKSSLACILAGEAWFTDCVDIGAEPKVIVEQTAGTWIVELAELSGIGNREVEQIKAMISRQVDRARLAYDKRVSDVPRQFVLVGTVNDSAYLRDTTGNRRFWPVRVGTVDLEALRADRNQLWAEAAHYEAQGARLDLPAELWAEAAAEQESRLVVDPWQERLEPIFDGRIGHVLIDDLWKFLDVKGDRQNGSIGRRLSQIMTRLSFEKKRLSHPTKGRLWAYTNHPRPSEGKWIEPGYVS
jgi:predicted P-loop ATPase